MPIGSTNVYNPGDLILSTVSGSGTSFIETKIIAATSSFILFNSSGTLTSASLNSIVATTSSYVSGSTSIITNLTASNISVSSTGSFGIVGIGTASPAAKLDVSANAVDIAIFRSSGGLANDKRLTITSGGEKVIFNVSDNSNTAIARAYEFQNAGTASMTLNSTGSLQVVNTGRIIGILRASSTPQTTFYDNTFAVNSDGGGANGFIYTSGTGGTFPLDFYGELILQSCPRTGYNNGISLVTGTTSPSVKLRVAENGNVGIGTTLPSEKLHVVGNGLITSGSAVDLRIDVSGTGNASLTIDRQTTGAESKILLLDANVSQWGIAAKADSNNFVIRDADSTERFTILKSGGNVGIGTSSPASKLHISGSGQTIMRLDSDTTSSVSQFQIKAASDAVLIMGMQGGSAASTNFGVTAAGQAYFGTSTLGSPHPTSLVIGNVSNIPIAFSTNNVERMRIDGVGNVGIGTTSATNKLEVIGGTNTRINLGNIDDVNRGGKLEIISGSATARQFYVGTNSAIYNLVFGIDSIEKMRIDTAGNVGIGTTSPAAKLDVVSSPTAIGTIIRVRDTVTLGTGSFAGIHFTSSPGTDYTIGKLTTAAGAGFLQIRDQSGNQFVTVDSGGNVGIGTTNPQFLLDVVNTSTTHKLRIGNAGSNNGAQLILAGSNTTKNWVIANQQNLSGTLEFTQTTATGSSTVDTTPSMVINSSGNVGIGTTSPTAKLHIYNGSSHFEATSNGNAAIVAGLYALQIAPLSNRDSTAGSYYGGIAFNHLLNHNGVSTYNGAPQAWIGTRLQDTAGSERDYLVFATKPGTGTSGTGNDIPIERMCIDRDGLVGIGTTVPTARLHVSGSTGGVFEVDTAGGVTSFYVSASGLVGIGTSSPAVNLEVVGASETAGTIRINGGKVNVLAVGEINSALEFAQRDASIAGLVSGKISSISEFSNGAYAGLGFYTAQQSRVPELKEAVRITNNGDVGIGTSNPAYLLDVSGSSRHGYRAADTHQFTGSVSVSGSLNATASWANNVVSASYALTSSFATRAQTANALNALNTYSIAGLTSAYVDVDGAGTIPTTGIYRPSTKTLGLSADGTLIFKISNVSSPATSSIETGNFVIQSGNVGIGTTSPTAQLHICLDTSTYPTKNVARIVNLGYSGITGAQNWTLRGAYQYGGGIALNADGGDLDLIKSLDRNTILATKTDGTQLGNVGIGTTNPTARLHVSGSTIITGSLNVSANITCLSLTETSTEAVKYNILPLPSQLDNVIKLKPVSFNYKANDKHSIGLIAEEVAKIYPEFTSDNNDSISYGKITSVLIQSIKELKTIIDNQQKQIENLIDKLK